MKNKVIYLILVLILTGCTARYDLEISNEGFYEKLTINATSVVENNKFVEYSYVVYYDERGNEEDPTLKVEGVEYYDSSLDVVNDFKVLEYSYRFNDSSNFKRSNIVDSAYSTFILKSYDHDEDGEKDYILLSTSDDFSRFKTHSELEKVIININCHYEVISSNADEVNGNVHTWYLTRYDLKAINLVYNPDKVIDNRTFWEKLKDGEYTNIFTVSVLLFIIGVIIYLVLRRKGERRNKV